MSQTLLPFRYISAFLIALLLCALAGGTLYGQSLRFTEASDTVREGSRSVTLQIVLQEAGAASHELVFQPNLSTAISDEFAEPPGRTIRFPENATPGTVIQVTIMLNDNDRFQPDRHAIFILRPSGESASAPSLFRLVIQDDDQPGVVISELLADPAGDANGDGIPGTAADRFVELHNREGAEVDLSGWVLAGSDGGILHRFGEGDRMAPNSGLVLFGGKTWVGPFGGSRVIGVPSLPLSPQRDRITLSDSENRVIDHFTYGPASPRGDSWIRGNEGAAAVSHTAAAGSEGTLWSPGLRGDGSRFSATHTLQGVPGWRVLSPPAGNFTLAGLLPGSRSIGLTDSEAGGILPLYTGYDGNGFLPPADIDRPAAAGTGLLYYYPGEESGTESGTAGALTLNPGETAPPAGNVTVPLHGEGDRWNLLGNPWNAVIDVRDISRWAVGGELESGVVQIWDGQNNSFIPVSANDYRVEPWQGFFIRNRDGDELEISRSAVEDRSSGRVEEDLKIAFTLVSGREGEQRLTDRAAVVTFTEGARHDWDAGDGEKLTPLSPDYVWLGIRGIKEGESVLKAQDSRPLEISGEMQIDLEAGSRNYEGPLALRWDLDGLPESWGVSLHDRVTGETVNLKTTDTYRFDYRRVRQTGEVQADEEQPPRLVSPRPDESQPPRFRLSVNGEPSESAARTLPGTVRLNPNYPNPFNESTTLSFELTENTHVNLSVWNMLGQKVATLIDEVMDAGEHERVWNAGNLPSTIYLIQLEVNGVIYNRKMVLIK